jgi:transposase
LNKTRSYEDFKEITSIGLDETSRAKRYEYITLFVDLEQRRTIFITKGKDNTTVKEFAEDFRAHNGKVDNIRNISCDMSHAFIKGVKKYLPKAEITFNN